MKTKRCVGAVIYNDEMKIFLMTSPKWNCWVIPGGRIEDGESEEEALHREIKEELNINITNLVKVGEQMKEPSESFIDKKVQFHYFLFHFFYTLTFCVYFFHLWLGVWNYCNISNNQLLFQS